jgi:hypothetical protein
MEIHFTPEQETQLSQIANHAGTDVEGLVKDAALRLLQEEARFRAAVWEGIAQADGASSLKKKKWTPAWSRCCARKDRNRSK